VTLSYVSSLPSRLLSLDIRFLEQEFGIDIVGEDNKTIVHHKVAARVVCVLTEQEAQLAARVESHQNPPSLSTLPSQPGSSNGTTAFNFTGTQTAAGPARRPALQQQALGGMGGMGANMRIPGKSGISFDHILSRLQGELQKSRETGAELHSLTGAMNEIHETLGGNLVSTVFLPSAPPTLIESVFSLNLFLLILNPSLLFSLLNSPSPQNHLMRTKGRP
jgi:hypothetical protein